MKIKHASLAALAALTVLLSSCVYSTPGNYGAFAYDTVYSSDQVWVASSYDANGFPIFGYSYGRPIYGYTAAGAAVYTFANLTASCYVPHWAPAAWYHGSWHYPSHIHRVGTPPHFPKNHRPSHRPKGGMNAPIHRNPASFFGAPKPAPRPHAGKPGPAPRPHAGKPGPAPRPGIGGPHRHKR